MGVRTEASQGSARKSPATRPIFHPFGRGDDVGLGKAYTKQVQNQREMADYRHRIARTCRFFRNRLY